ncbi:hypothetical protein vseg_006920 [Gypsophila vaccaria]
MDPTLLLLDNLYCHEQNWDTPPPPTTLHNTMLFDDDRFCDDAELRSLFHKETTNAHLHNNVGPLVVTARNDGVHWMLRVCSIYGFGAMTAYLSVVYFDRCIVNIPFIQPSKKWTFQLAAVACLSLAAKVDETCVPFLLELQVEGASPVFEPRDVQKMELLVLTTLEWKMHPVTPLSFLDHIIRRLGLKHHLHWEFLKRCESVLLSLLPDWRFVSYLPSVLATATMMHVIDQIEPCDSLEYQTQLLNVLNISKEKVKECYELIIERSSVSTTNDISIYNKRKFEQMNNINNTIVPRSPSGVVDGYNFSSESSNDSWTATGGPVSVSSSPVASRKKGRVHEKPMPLQLPSMSRVFVDFATSPR